MAWIAFVLIKYKFYLWILQGFSSLIVEINPQKLQKQLIILKIRSSGFRLIQPCSSLYSVALCVRSDQV
jgi:hypothetical protein